MSISGFIKRNNSISAITEEANVTIISAHQVLNTTQLPKPTVEDTPCPRSVNISNFLTSITSHLNVYCCFACSVHAFVTEFWRFHYMHVSVIYSTNGSWNLEFWSPIRLGLIHIFYSTWKFNPIFWLRYYLWSNTLENVLLTILLSTPIS